MTPITISTLISADQQKVWDLYTQPEHITQWNFADPRWHCPNATNDLKLGGQLIARMEARDGSFGFDFDVTYTAINPGRSLSYTFDGRNAEVLFEEQKDATLVTIQFDPESENPVELQKSGWQAILNNFKSYVESK
jgi:uncharacterized protein YndB with AHSA1/START domain